MNGLPNSLLFDRRGTLARGVACAMAVELALGLAWDKPAIAASNDTSPFVFSDVTREAGLLPAIAGLRAHAAGWGDADHNGWPDLYVGTFHQGESKPNLFFRNSHGHFTVDTQTALRLSARSDSALFADLDNDGDLDLYVASMPAVKERVLAGCSLFRNDGDGRFTNLSAGNGACPADFMGRSAATLDFDGDGLLDLLVGEDPSYARHPRSRLFRNLGGLQFEEVSLEAGLPDGIPALGVAAGDVNNDGWPDIFLAARGEGNRLFLNNGRGKFYEAPGTREIFRWAFPKNDDSSAGVCFGDVNRDGWLDVVIGQHFKTPWVSPVPVRLYLNRGVFEGRVRFEEVTAQAGLIPLPMKAPHVQIEDFDNDGWPDVYVSLVKFAHGKVHPLIFRNLGLQDGDPQFAEHALAVNDFPTEQDRAARGSTAPFYQRMLRERKIAYMAPGPAADYNRDGRLDIFLGSWWPELPSILLRNDSPAGHWLDVRLQAQPPINRMGIGARVEVYETGHANEPAARLGVAEIHLGCGYVSSHPAVAHFGLGKRDRCDVLVRWPHGRGQTIRENVRLNQTIVITP